MSFVSGIDVYLYRPRYRYSFREFIQSKL